MVFSSIRSLVVEPGQAVYAATKAGIVQMVRTLAAELGPSGLRVNAVAPRVVETPLTAPIRSNPDWYEAYAAKSVFNRWARVEEMVGADGVSCLGRRELRKRNGALLGWWLDGCGRAVSTARDVSLEPSRTV